MYTNHCEVIAREIFDSGFYEKLENVNFNKTGCKHVLIVNQNGKKYDFIVIFSREAEDSDDINFML